MEELPCDVEPKDDDPIVAMELRENDAEIALQWLAEHGHYDVVERVCRYWLFYATHTT